ncbi:Ankyrin repeat and SOCS box protein 13 [Stylophora pistillata]|uniref:Ankyrin repeat and SOCS box protein 13 n=1 Tax=Stylophora pistillata TaxID=50429 RepID=A0A2B4S9K1_STYPI|nr:Ankyrin repeat and SOCS box protein 13 [Stylophora pistillata]
MGTGASTVEKHESTTSMVNYEPRDPKSVMFNSARTGNEKDLTLVLQQGMDPNERESQFSRTLSRFLCMAVFIIPLFSHSLRALHFTARHGHSHCLEILIKYGADVTAEDFYGWQAIHEAALNGHIDCLASLLEKGAKVDSATYNNNGPNTPLHYAARHGYVESVRLLLMYGADWKSVNNFGETPLHCTAMRGYVDCMQTLVRAEADHETPLHMCVQKHDREFTKLLIKANADLNIRDSRGNRPIDMKHLNDDVVNILRAAMFEKERVNTATTS